MRNIRLLLVVQFLSAFADNAILFTAFAMLLRDSTTGGWYQSALQGSFLLAFVLLAPWVGRFADRRIKTHVLAIGNGIKAIGALLFLFGVEPLFAYAVVGMGAAIYGPAKYGILPELVSHDRLVSANGYVEGSTIVAIVVGAMVGAAVADYSISVSLAMIMVIYLASLTGSFFIPPKTPEQAAGDQPALPAFGKMMRGFFVTSRARFAMLGAAVFWATAILLRVVLVDWAPAVLGTKTASDIAGLTVYIAIGIAVGSVIVPLLVPIDRLRRARLAAYLMGVTIILFAANSAPVQAKALLFIIGMLGGIFVVPINAALQDIGHHTIGTGGAVAVQNFFQNLAMLIGTGLYSLALTRIADPVLSVYLLGLSVILATALVSWHLPPEPKEQSKEVAEHEPT